MKTKFCTWRMLLCVCLVSFRLIAPAQVVLEESKPQLVVNAPALGTFYLLQKEKSPPYPFDPYFGQLPVFFWDGVFFVDDTKVDYVSLQAESISGFGFGGEGGGMMMMSGAAPCNPCSTNGNGFVGTNYSGPLAGSFSSNELWLEIITVTNQHSLLRIHAPDSNALHDVYYTTNLTRTVAGLNQTNWMWRLRTNGTHAFLLTNLALAEGWFQLGTLLDDDLDGLTTAYENLVSHTKWEAGDGWDSDGDGLSDDFELRHSLTDPNNPDTGNTGVPDGYKDPDGDGWTHIDEMRNGTDPLVFNTPSAPFNFQIQVVSNGTSLLLTWEPSYGPVLGYAINGFFLPASFNTNAASNVFSLVITNTGDTRNRFQISALYPNEVAVSSIPVSPYFSATLNPTSYRVRGQDNSRYVAIPSAPPSAASLFLSDPYFADSASIPLEHFSNGIARLPGSVLSNAFHYGDNFTFLNAQFVATNGLMSVPDQANCENLLEQNSESSLWRHLPFVDARHVILDNAKFALRAATLNRQFAFGFYGYLGRSPVSTNYEMSEFQTRYSANRVAPDVRRPFQESFLWRNFCFDPDVFDLLGFATGAFRSSVPDSFGLQSPWFEFDGSSIQSQLTTNISRWIYFGYVGENQDPGMTNIGIVVSGTNFLLRATTNIYGLALPRFGGQVLGECIETWVF